MIFAISYILVGVLVLILISRFSEYDPDKYESIPPVIMVFAWPAVGFIGILGGILFGGEYLHQLSCAFVQKCKKGQPKPPKKTKS